MEFFKKTPTIDFVRIGPICAAISALLFAVSLALILVRGFNFGIDFAGGTVVQVRVGGEAPVGEGSLRDALAAVGQERGTVVRFGPEADRSFLITLPGISTEEQRDLPVELPRQLAEKLGAAVELARSESVGPRISAELARNGAWAMLISWVAILIYIWFRFELVYAPGAVIALIHDATITAGVFAAFQLEFDQQILAALLTIIGYSVNDTIVIYDRIRENQELHGKTRLEEVVNQSVNQTLSRTILTSGATLLTVLALLFFGGPVLWGFALALTIGIVVGSYSTIYVASTLMIWLERRFGARAPAPSKTQQQAKA
jgi:preprotein translocase subunit SecF